MNTAFFRLALLMAALSSASLAPVTAVAQGQDGTPGERNLQIMAELLAGRYDNANQAYFDSRLQYPEDQHHVRTQVVIETTDDASLGAPLFSYTMSRGETGERELWLLQTADDPQVVLMKRYTSDGRSPTYRSGCDVLWRRDAGQFTGTNDSAGCAAQMQLTPAGLWLDAGDGNPGEMWRARPFTCHADIPGVGGGRDEPFDRYRIPDMHDQGALHWFTTLDGEREIGITLRNVRWPMNNEIGAFTRDSLVLYIIEKTPDGVKEHGYGWTEPRAKRIGVNLKWLLVNCYQVSNEDVTPFFD